jgi:hypothetical protein
MALEVRIITGPPSARVTKEAAAKKLAEHPQFPEGAAYELEDVDGRWIAAIASEKVAEFPPAKGEEGPPAEAPEPPAEDGPPTEDGPPVDDGEGEDKPKEDKGEKGDEKGKGGELAKIEHLLTTLLTALGLDPAGADGSPVPGPDADFPGGPEGGPEGLDGGAPTGPPAPGHDDKTHTVHERALKPGEAPPGSTPVGAPAFASVADDHPWKGVLGKKRTFKVEEEIGDQPLSSVQAELSQLADGTGYSVAQLTEAQQDGRRVARALISR